MSRSIVCTRARAPGCARAPALPAAGHPQVAPGRGPARQVGSSSSAEAERDVERARLRASAPWQTRAPRLTSRPGLVWISTTLSRMSPRALSLRLAPPAAAQAFGHAGARVLKPRSRHALHPKRLASAPKAASTLRAARRELGSSARRFAPASRSARAGTCPGESARASRAYRPAR